MPKNRVIIILGTCVALLPILGFPKVWESFFQVVAGLGIIGVSIWANIDRKLKLQHKAQQRAVRKVAPPLTPGVVPPVTDEFGKRVTDFYPKTGQPGRRSSDMGNVRSSDIVPPGPEKTEN
jgi:hypothetical protein